MSNNSYFGGIAAGLKTLATGMKVTMKECAEMDDTVLYAEPTLQGNAVIAKRKAGSRETQMNLELLFNAAMNGKL